MSLANHHMQDSDLADDLLPASESVQPEIDWMRRIKAGDMEAFRLLVETHQARAKHRSLAQPAAPGFLSSLNDGGISGIALVTTDL
jgi:hypothetical protein